MFRTEYIGGDDEPPFEDVREDTYDLTVKIHTIKGLIGLIAIISIIFVLGGMILGS